MAWNYEEWKSNTRQAGAKGYDAYLKTQQGGGGTPAPTPAPAAPSPSPAPTPAPRAGGGAPAPAPTGGYPGGYEAWAAANRAAGGQGNRQVYDFAYGGGDPSKVLGQGGAGTDEQRRTGGMASGSFGDDSRDAGNANTGDPYLDELRGGQVAGSEDWRRFDNDVLKSWQPYYVGGGKFRNKYGDIVGKPVDSGPNTPKGVDGMGHPIAGGGGGGGGRGGGAGGGSASGFSGRGSGGDLENMLQDNLKQLLSGEGTRYTPEVMQGILAKIKQQTEGSVRRQQEEARSEAAGRGMARAGATGARLDDIRRGAEAGFTGEYADLLTKKVDADYQDKMAGIDRAQKYIDSLKLQMYRQDMTALQREQLRAQIQMAEMNISAQRENLQTSIQANKDAMGAQFYYGQLDKGAG